jgi:TolB-like protein
VANSVSSEPAATPAPEADARRLQLGRILDSADFDATDRDRRFLAYVVEESLAGRADRIKAYSIALEAFGRDASFDPQTDPIVRVEAGHLRRALDRYYLTAGRDDPIVITIPKGGYAPMFATRPVSAPDPVPEAPPAAAAPRVRARVAVRVLAGLALLALAFLAGVGFEKWAGGAPDDSGAPRLVIDGFEAFDASGPAAVAAMGLTSELIAEVARFKDMVVVAPSVLGTVAPRYRLTGGVALDGEVLRVQARLLRLSDGAVIWARSYPVDLATERGLSAESRIAGEIATAIGQPYGAIFQADTAWRMAHPPRTEDAYGCTLAYFSFQADLDPSSFAKARACLEGAVARFPENATSWGLLAQIHLDGIRWGFSDDVTPEQAVGEARRALSLDPLNVRALQAKMLALFFTGDIQGALDVGQMARAVNPNDTELLGEYGLRLALSGRWSEGCPMLRGALDENPGPLPYYEIGLALCAYFSGDYAEAARWIRSTPVENVPVYHVVAAGIFAEDGDAEAARREWNWLAENAPDFARDPRAQLLRRAGRSEDVDRLLNSVRKAGIDIPN